MALYLSHMPFRQEISLFFFLIRRIQQFVCLRCCCFDFDFNFDYLSFLSLSGIHSDAALLSHFHFKSIATKIHIDLVKIKTDRSKLKIAAKYICMHSFRYWARFSFFSSDFLNTVKSRNIRKRRKIGKLRWEKKNKKQKLEKISIENDCIEAGK